MSNENDVNASQDQIVDGQTDTADVNVKPEATKGESKQEVADPAKVVQTPEENSAFKEMRLKQEALEAKLAQQETERLQIKRDATYKAKYPDLDFESEAEMVSLYGEYGIASYEDLDSYMKLNQEAEQKQVSPEFYREFNDLKQQLNDVTSEKQKLAEERDLIAIKTEMAELYGDIFTDNESEIMAIAERMNMKNANGIKASVATVITDKFPTIMKEMREQIAKAKEAGVSEFIASKKNQIPVEGSGATPVSVGSKPTNMWETARKNSIEILKSKT